MRCRDAEAEARICPNHGHGDMESYCRTVEHTRLYTTQHDTTGDDDDDVIRHSRECFSCFRREGHDGDRDRVRERGAMFQLGTFQIFKVYAFNLCVHFEDIHRDTLHVKQGSERIIRNT